MKSRENIYHQYRSSLFHQPGRSGIPLRILGRAWQAVWIRRFDQTSDLQYLSRSLLWLSLLALSALALLAGHPLDIWRVWNDSGYDQASEVLAWSNARNEFITIAEFYRQGRRVIHLADNPEGALQNKVAKCFIAAEDTQFRHHIGVDLQGIGRAALVNLQAGRIREGASTISQQVARLRFLSQERSFLRKLREAWYALLLEIRFSKARILETYLNEVHLGHGANGVESASQFYFNKSWTDLTWGEAALLSSLTTRPRDFSPLRNINESRQKVQVTFRKLIENGDLNISAAEGAWNDLEQNYYRQLNRSPWDSARNQRINQHPYVTEYIRSLVLQHITPQRLLTGGLRIYTTIVDEHQSAAEEKFIEYLRKQSERRHRRPFERFDLFYDEFDGLRRMNRLLFPVAGENTRITRNQRRLLRDFVNETMDEAAALDYLIGSSRTNRVYEYYQSYGEKFVEEEQKVEGALVSLRPVSGEITAIIGGSGFASRNQLMRFESALRQPGSSFKPLVYSACMDYSGRNPRSEFVLTPATMIEDAPVHFVNRDLTEYAPENYSHSYDGWMRLRTALTKSKNSVAVQVYKNCGPGNINPTVEKMLGLESRSRGARHLPREAAVALGSFGVSPLEMARAYAVFASGGKEVHPWLVTHITEQNKDQLVMDFRKKHAQLASRQLIAPATARIMVSMLEDVVQAGTGQAARLPGNAVAGKTGTTNRNTNAWFVGFTPGLVTALYLGYDKPVSLGYGATGGGLAAPIWGRYMTAAMRTEPNRSFRFSADIKLVNLEICADTGALPTAGCANRMVEMFLPGTQPRDSKSPLSVYESENDASNVQHKNQVIRKETDVYSEDF
ncbi:MAG: PBP1A family penicillin-binding protein [Leptospiraceae bacterium]|nr:PBP1A family penicillin-binding protein [Leptospiraceae bacterium]